MPRVLKAGTGLAHLQFTRSPGNDSWQRNSPAHALQCLREHLWGHAVLVLQDEALLQCHRHGCAVLGTLAAGKPDTIKAAANLPRGK